MIRYYYLFPAFSVSFLKTGQTIPVRRTLWHPWPLTNDYWPMAIDQWPLTNDHWPMTIDLWPLTIKKDVLVELVRGQYCSSPASGYPPFPSIQLGFFSPTIINQVYIVVVCYPPFPSIQPGFFLPTIINQVYVVVVCYPPFPSIQLGFFSPTIINQVYIEIYKI